MSAETVLPPEGPAGPEQELQQQETRLLLDNSHDTCTNENNESSATADTARIPASREHSADEQGDVLEENHTHGDLVRTQPQPLAKPHPAACLQQPSEGEGARLHNGLHAGLSNGHRMPRGGTQPAAAATAAAASSSESRKHPSPVSQRMQKKLRSSLSVNSDSSRRSKGSSTGSHKPGSSPEDCCVHCILACLFCEFLTLCNMVVAQASCGTCTSEACCCCCCADDLGDDCNCPCDMDCGIMDACCESSDCLEICMECCGICFPT
ncbi:myoD family inhibitor domain-containing protein [Astyanax mexicanus]|uniref:MyoD family inhibitor domain containing n=1 Tax=Astyanax mexicanus TaxID=7994 RepID=A0A3B1KIB4_ASTMX|nr:myoD family inhibitor domain-containing protein [Astyanax mexicanus]XP_007252779.2 myoD family inhibitor domain-containing protein [Astyanax mexicanus]